MQLAGMIFVIVILLVYFNRPTIYQEEKVSKYEWEILLLFQCIDIFNNKILKDCILFYKSTLMKRKVQWEPNKNNTINKKV